MCDSMFNQHPPSFLCNAPEVKVSPTAHIHQICFSQSPLLTCSESTHRARCAHVRRPAEYFTGHFAAGVRGQDWEEVVRPVSRSWQAWGGFEYFVQKADKLCLSPSFDAMQLLEQAAMKLTLLANCSKS